MKSHSKNKYAQRTGRSKRLKEFMHKVEVWLPTLTYNRLKQSALVQGLEVEQLAANGLYRTINANHGSLVSWYIPEIKGVTDNLNRVVDILSKFILATLKTGISQDDLMMNALDSHVSYEEIIRALNQMSETGMIEVDDKGILRYKYFSPIEKHDSLVRFKGKKVISKIKAEPIKRESLVKKRTKP